MFRFTATAVLFLGVTIVVIADPVGPGEAIDTERSSIMIHVRKAGIFAAAAHEHWVNAPIASGTVDAGATAGVQFVVDARKLSVKPDKGVSAKDQAEVQSNMQTKVLESSAYPEILFRSNQVSPTHDNSWRLSGDLTLHGATKPVIIDVTRENDAYIGNVLIKQTDFGIQPIKIGGGAVRVKDEIEIRFRVYTVKR